MKTTMIGITRTSFTLLLLTIAATTLIVPGECSGCTASSRNSNSSSSSNNFEHDETTVTTTTTATTTTPFLRNTSNNNNQRKLQDTFCGLGCFSNDNCQAATDGCNMCNGFVCYNPYKCGVSCTTHGDCSCTQDDCYFCNNNICSNEIPGGDDRTCVNTNALFQSALNNINASTITLCSNTQLVLSGNGDAFTSNRSGFTINCQSGNSGGNCGIIRKGGSGRLLNLSGDSITIVGINFDHGSGSDGGAIYIQGGNNNIENCLFRDNFSIGNGGAVNWLNGSSINNIGFNNQASQQCNGIYSRDTNTCDISVNTGTNNQCNAYCDNTNLFCSRVSGNCGTCDVNSKICVGTTTNNCGQSCNTSSDCANFFGGGPCNICDLGQCVQSTTRTCVNNESALRIALQSQNVVDICQNSQIQVTTGELFTTLPNQTLQCQGGSRSCTLLRPSGTSSFRLLHSTGNNFQLLDIIFQNGNSGSGGDGGGAYLLGTNNIVRNVEFVGNSAPSGRGGAMAIQSGTVIDCEYTGNSAPQCVNTFVISDGTCQN